MYKNLSKIDCVAICVQLSSYFTKKAVPLDQKEKGSTIAKTIYLFVSSCHHTLPKKLYRQIKKKRDQQLQKQSSFFVSSRHQNCFVKQQVRQRTYALQDMSRQVVGVSVVSETTRTHPELVRREDPGAASTSLPVPESRL